MDFCRKSIGFADFENIVARGSAVKFSWHGFLIVPVLMFGSKRNLDHRFFFSLGRYVNEFIQIILFFKRSSFKLRCETAVIGIVIVIRHVAF